MARADLRVDRNELPSMRRQIRSKCGDVVREVSELVEQGIQAGWGATDLPIDRAVSGLTATIGVGSRSYFYPGFLEYGTKDRPATPVATPAAEDRRDEFITRVIDAMRSLG